MDNSINSGVSFQAKLVSSVKGKNNIMDQVAKKFESMTKSIPGELYVDRDLEEGFKHVAEIRYEGASYGSFGLFKLLSKAANGKSTVDEIASKFASQLRVLAAENSYYNKAYPIEDSISEMRESIKRAKAAKARADRLGLNELSEQYTTVIKSYKDNYRDKIPSLKKKLSVLLDKTSAQMDKYKANSLDPEYKDFFVEDAAENIHYL